MTLVATVLTQNFAIMASDRRIVWGKTKVDGSREVLAKEDADTKAIVIDGRFLMGFAGLGRYFEPGEVLANDHGWRMEGWILNTLAAAPSPTTRFEYLADRAGELCERVAYMKKHVFATVGFDGETIEPIQVNITNSPQSPHTFHPYTEQLGDRRTLTSVFGLQVDEGALADLRGFAEYVDKWSPVQPYPLYRRLVQFVRDQAILSDGRVGETVLVTSLPRVAVPSGAGLQIWTQPPPVETFQHEEVSVMFSPALGGVLSAPARVSEGLILGGVSVSTEMGDDEWFGPLEGFMPPSDR